jgi:hypothetical protein
VTSIGIQPDAYLPDTATNAAPGFAAYAATTQSDWETQINDAMHGHFLSAEGGFDLILNFIYDLPFIGPLIEQIVEAITGLLSGDLTDLAAFFEGFVSGIPILGQIVEAITGLFSGGLTDLTDFFSGFLSGIPIVGQLTEAITGIFGDLGDLFSFGALGTYTPVPSINLTGQIPHYTMTGLLPAPAVTSISPNAFVNPFFHGSTALTSPMPGGNWVQDATTTFTDPDTAAVSQSAKVTADGAANSLLSNQIRVSPGESVALSVRTKWAGLAYTGSNPIGIGVTKYAMNAVTHVMEETGFEDLASIVAPVFSSGTWQTLAANYVVPLLDDERVDEIRMHFKIGANLTAGQVWFAAAEGVKNHPGTVDNIVNNLLGWTGTGFSHTDSAAALQAQSEAILSNAAQIEQIKAQLNTAATPTAAVTTDDFERTASTLGSNWSESYSSGYGTWIVDGHNAVWDSDYPNGNVDSINRFIGTGSTSTIDYQTISTVLSSGPTKKTGYAGANYVIGRMNTTGTSFVVFIVSAYGTWSLATTTTGTPGLAVLTNGTLSAIPGNGAVLTLVCGDKATTTPRFYTCKIGTTVLASGAYGDTTSNYGASYRCWGFGGSAQGAMYGSSQGKPGGVNQWTGQDTP